MKCPVCQTKELTGKQKVCSGACRIRQKRLGTASTGMPQMVSTGSEEKATTNLTAADLSYQEGYETSTGQTVTFADELFTRTCLLCGTKFQTHLRSLRTCSYDHYDEMLTHLAA